MASGEIINAERALSLGLVNRVVAAEELDREVERWAARLCSGPAVAIARIKKALHYAEVHTLAEALDFEAVQQAACFASQDFREGVAAFVEKRQPVFRGA